MLLTQAMNRVKNADRDLLNLKLDDETGLSHSRCLDAAVPRSDAVWLFPAGAVCDDGGFWHHGISVLHKAEGDSGGGVRCAGAAVPAHL